MSWQLTASDLPDLARGATLLGTGGGGDPYIGMMLVRRVLGDGEITILDPDELDDDLFVIPTAQMGAPTVMIEKIPAGTEPTLALRTLEEHLGHTADATMPIECGGINSMIPLVVAAETGLPVVDADGMGRAFPELSMETFAVYGVHGSPLALAGERGERVVIDTGDDDRQMEWLARGVTIRLGGVGHIAEYAMTGADVKRTAVPRTISMALALGRAIREAREQHRSPFEAIEQTLKSTLYCHLRELFVGKVTDVERRTTEGFAKGRAVISALDAGAEIRAGAGIGADAAVGGGRADGRADGRTLEISFQNENLVARRDGEVVAIVPDLICVVDVETAEPITTEGLRYGQRVRVLGISTPEMMRTPDALKAFGPTAFGLSEAFVPVEARA
jgi:Uncharacterized conserved protein